MTRTYLAVDLGGTNSRYGLVNQNGEVLRRGRFPIHSYRGPEPIIEDLIVHLRSFLDALSSGQRPRALVVGAAGLIRAEDGVLVAAPNLPGWKNIPLADILGQALSLEVRLENDANLYALGEWFAGAGRHLSHLIVVTLGTGVGGGLILNGRLWNGSFLSAGEIGHVIVEPEGRPCGCGGRGCLETVASATAITRTAREWIMAGQPCAFSGHPDDLTSRDLYGLARQGDALARRVFDRAGWALGLALTNVFNILGLQGAVIGGGVSAAYDFIRPSMFEEFSTRVFAVDPNRIRLAPAALGDDAPLAGVPVLFQKSGDPQAHGAT